MRIIGGRLKGTALLAVSAAAIFALVICLFAAFRFVSFLSAAYGRDSPLGGISVPSGELPVSLTIYGRGTDTLSMRLRFLGPTDGLLGTMERSWTGWELTLDAIVVGTGSGWLVFPFRVYTDAPRSGNGLDLIRYYDRGGFPALWDEKALTDEEEKALRAIFGIVRTERWMPRIFGSLHHERLRVRNFEAGAEYILSVLGDGTLELLRN